MEVKVQNVCFAYNRHDTLILDSINFKVMADKVTAIIGESGSGKTTLLDIISGIKIPTKGKVVIGDIVISKRTSNEALEKLKSRVGYLSQCPEERFYCDTVRNDFYAYLDDLKITINNLDDRISEVFKMLNLDESLLDRDPFSLSNGELRQVALSLILIYNPSVIILDEPTVGLDSAAKQTLVNVLTKVKKLYSKTIIVVSHDIDFVHKVADSFILLKEGKVIKSENKDEMFKDVKFFTTNKISVPQIILFEDIAQRTKGIRLGYRTEINDLVKDILRKI